MITLVETSQPSVYLVKDVPADWSLTMIAAGVQRFITREWPCPMMTYNATRYSVLAKNGRKNRNNVYVRIALS